VQREPPALSEGRRIAHEDRRIPLLPGEHPRSDGVLPGGVRRRVDGHTTKGEVDPSAGGSTVVALEKQFWGDTFGTLTNRFGISWQVNIEAKT